MTICRAYVWEAEDKIYKLVFYPRGESIEDGEKVFHQIFDSIKTL
ncbi:MAG: hypothetical protein N2558_00190 [Patescibacteria group bacterium]|nr:hypothetical protein [Patescibacteria group bacterium]